MEECNVCRRRRKVESVPKSSSSLLVISFRVPSEATSSQIVRCNLFAVGIDGHRSGRREIGDLLHLLSELPLSVERSGLCVFDFRSHTIQIAFHNSVLLRQLCCLSCFLKRRLDFSSLPFDLVFQSLDISLAWASAAISVSSLA